MASAHHDVVVIGAGIAGIHAAYELRNSEIPRDFVVVDALDGPGGTWRTHTFPGVRSDTEVFTLGYSFKPWTGVPYASGQEILDYLTEVIEENDLGAHFLYHRRLISASWSSEDQRWTLKFDVQSGDVTSTETMTASFLWMCHGYYRHDEPHRPNWPGMESFEGQWIHPQHWPKTSGVEGKRVLVIGSGATAATLVPAIAAECAHVTLLQRSPTYYFQSANEDDLATQLRGLATPPEWIHEILRRKAVKDMESITATAKQFPGPVRDALIGQVAAQLPEGYDIETHFTPHHQPADQRICRILNGDLFAAISRGDVTMVTDHIETVTPGGVRTAGGIDIDAEVIITATGFDLSIFGEAAFDLDGAPVDFSSTVTYRGILFSDVPNLAWTFGALRLSWTMRVELVSNFVLRLLDELKTSGSTSVVPCLNEKRSSLELSPF
ncbi:MAG: NAD(P)/FAD-dependent oxidoreductase, partial [Actinomycetota bacterium]